MHLLTNIGVELWTTLCEMAPYLILGFLIAGVLSVFISAETVEKHLGGRGLWPVIKAALVGVPIPLCSCGVIPVAASLRRHGASKGATTAFLISTPQTGVDSIAVTYGMLGPVFAVFRPVAAFVSGLLGGWIVELSEGHQNITAPEARSCTDDCCSPSTRGNRITRVLRYSFVTLPRDLARPLIIGLVVAGVISALIPQDFFSRNMGSGLVQMLMMMAFGIPLYVCATASVPIAAAMLLKGISPGAALVFLMTGPATNAAAIATIWKTMGRRTAIIYLAVVAGTALVSGILLDHVFTVGKFSPTHLCHEMLPGWFQAVCAISILLMLAATFITSAPAHEGNHHEPAGSTTVELKIAGMTCSHCEDTVKRTLRSMPGVQSVSVSRSSGTAIITGSGWNMPAVIKAIGDIGFKAEETHHALTISKS